MGFGIYSTIYGANSRSIEMEILANNLANMQTNGFKEQIVAFTTEVDKDISGYSEIQKLQAPVRVFDSQHNMRQGSLYETGGALDMAIQGDGFFVVETPDGPRYTRAGNFAVNAQGTLVTQQGHPVMTESGSINVPPNTNISVSPSGEVTIGDDFLAKIQVRAFKEPSKLVVEGNGYFHNQNTGQTPQEPTSFRIAHRHLESSNVDMVKSMTKIIEVARAYEAHQKSLNRQIDTASQLNKILSFNG